MLKEENTVTWFIKRDDKYIEENYNINDDIRILEIGIGSRRPYNCNIKKIRKI